MELNYPMELFEQILRQTKEDYIEAYKVILEHTGKYHPDIEELQKKLVKENKRLEGKIDLYNAACRELRRISSETGQKFDEALEALAKERKIHRNKLVRLDNTWDALMMLEECVRYLNKPETQTWIDMSGEQIAEIWRKYALKEYREQEGKPKHTNKKLDEEIIAKILEMHEQGASNREICRTLGISADPVRKYIKERSKQ